MNFAIATMHKIRYTIEIVRIIVGERRIKYSIKELRDMDLVTVKELYKNREQYFDKEVTVGGWVRSNRDSKAFGSHNRETH